jgi:putative ABC transport system permease protein
MSTFRLAIKNLFNKPMNLILSLILFSLGVGLISFLLLFNKQLNEKFQNNLADIDLVIGAKGSPLQLILCNMYHVDNPTGNINIKDAKPFLNPKHPLIAKAVPLSLGDSYRSYRIIGTNHDILEIYNGSIDKGRLWKKDLEVVIGNQVANKASLKIGDSFVSSHGFTDDEDLAHDHAKFKVVGILKPTGSVIDQLILTNTASIWEMHDHPESGPIIIKEGEEHKHEEKEKHDHNTAHHDDHESHDHEGEHDHHDHAETEHNHSNHDDHESDTVEVADDGHIHDNSITDLLSHEDKQITSILIKYKNKKSLPALNMPRSINENTAMQAASPAYEINKLYSMIGTGTETIRSIAILIALVSLISIFISLYSSLKEKKYELALMRVLGSGRSNLFLLILFEGIIIAILGWVLGTLISHIGLAFMGHYLSEDFRYSFDAWRMISEEWWILLVSIALGIVAALIPAYSAYNTDINKTLGKQ